MKTSDAVPIEGKITGVSGQVPFPDGSLGYTTQSVRYTIAATIGGRVTYFANQRPQIRLWGDSQRLDAGRLLGCGVPGVMLGNDLRWHFYEPPALAGCAETPAPSLLSPDGRGAAGQTTPGGDTGLPPVDGGPTDQPGGSPAGGIS